MRRSRTLVSVLFAAVSVVAPVTAGAAPAYSTRTLDATELWTSSHRSHEWDTSVCRWALDKLNDRQKPEPDTALVGYVDAYAESSWLLGTCWEKDDYAYRARPVFDLDELGDDVAGIKTATLGWHESASELTPDGDGIRYGDDRLAYCASRLLVATTPPGSGTGLSPGYSLGTIHGTWSTTKGPLRYVVTDTVRKWFNGDRPNYGFVLRGSETYDRDNGRCLSTVGNFTLQVSFRRG